VERKVQIHKAKVATAVPTAELDMSLEKEIISWEAPERTYQERDRDFWVTAISILVLISVILIFIKEFFLIMALFSVLFLYYVLSTVKPGSVICRITNKAVYFGEVRYEWKILSSFWFKHSLSYEILNIGTNLTFPRQISLVINPREKELIKEIMQKRLPMLQASPGTTDKIIKWVGERLPLESRKK